MSRPMMLTMRAMWPVTMPLTLDRVAAPVYDLSYNTGKRHMGDACNRKNVETTIFAMLSIVDCLIWSRRMVSIRETIIVGLYLDVVGLEAVVAVVVAVVATVDESYGNDGSNGNDDNDDTVDDDRIAMCLNVSGCLWILALSHLVWILKYASMNLILIILID